MYAVVKTGGKQYRVEENQVLQVEILGDIGESVSLTPLMLVDGNTVLAKPSELENVNVSAEIVDKGNQKKLMDLPTRTKVTSADDGDIARTITKSKSHQYQGTNNV